MSPDVAEWFIKIPVLLFAITIHEYSHGKAALSLGDTTARDAGRLTMNPISHIDPVGAIVFFIANFGWAKPVPVDISKFKNIRRDTILMAISGPFANFGAALMAGLLIRYMLFPHAAYFNQLLVFMVLMNTGLGLFNLIPLPPFDGSHVVENLLPPRLGAAYHRIGRFTPILFLGIIILERAANLNIFGAILGYPIFYLSYLFAGPNLFRLL
jgi:Zn-dependent protease